MTKPWRWELLDKREKQVALLYIEKNMKADAICHELGIERTRIFQILGGIYRVLGVADQVELAFEMGKHYKDIKR